MGQGRSVYEETQKETRAKGNFCKPMYGKRNKNKTYFLIKKI